MYRFTLFLIFVACQIGVHAQQSNQITRSVDLYFDSAGRVISFPPAILRPQKKICAKVVLPAAFFFTEINRFRSMLVKTYQKLTEEKINLMYRCYYKDSSKFNFNQYVRDLELVISLLDEEKFELKDSTTLFANLKGIKYLPGYNFIQHFFKQYELRVYRGEAIVARRKLTAVTYDKKKNCYYFGTECMQIKDLECNNCGRQPEQLSFRLYKTNPFDQALKEWFEIKNAELATLFGSGVESAFSKMAGTPVDHADFDTRNNTLGDLRLWFPNWFWFTGGELVLDPFGTPDNKALGDSVKFYAKVSDSAAQQRKFYDSILTKVNYSAAEFELFKNVLIMKNKLLEELDNADTVIARTKREIAGSPTPNAGRLAALSNTLRHSIAVKDSLVQQRAFIESMVLKDNNAAAKFELYKMIYPKLQASTKSTDSLNKIKEAVTKNHGKKLYGSVNTQPNSYLNKTAFVVSTPNKIRPQIQFDASNGYDVTATNKRALHRITELPDNENGIVFIHNIDSTTKLKYTQTWIPFKDDPEFTQLLSEQLSKLDLTRLSAKELTDVQDFTRSFFKNVPVKGASLSDDECKEMKMIIYNRLKKLSQEYISKNSTSVYDKSIFTETEPLVPVFHSEAERLKFRFETAHKDSIAVIKVAGGKDTTVMQTYVKVSRLKFIHLASGIAVNNQAVVTNTIDTVGGGLRISNSDNKAKAIIGFKIYPFQHYTRDRWLLPRYPLRRIAVFAGFEMLRPLDNFYLGGSYDLVPGLAFSAGANFYLKKTYKVENNIVTQTQRSYDSKGIYYSVTVDPEIFVKFIKLFFK